MTGRTIGRQAIYTLTLLPASLALAAPAAAQEAGVAADRPILLDEIVVTAQRREQSASDVPISLNILTGQDINDRGLQDLRDLADLTPSLDVFRGNGSNNPTITLRGVGTTNPWINNNPSVAAHVDDVYLPLSAYMNFPVFDLERIEVLKGPQVGLYGRNSTAGAINFITARPTRDTTGYLDVSYGRFDAVEAQGAISGSVTDNLQLRLAAMTRQGGGYMDRPGTGSLQGFTRAPGTIPALGDGAPGEDYGDADVFALRGSLMWQPAANVDVYLSLHHAKDDSELVASTLSDISAAQPPLATFGFVLPPGEHRYTDFDDDASAVDAEQQGGVLQIDVRFGDYTLTSLSGFERLDRAYSIGDMVPLRIAATSFDEDIESFYQELRLSSYVGDFQWLAGVSYSRDKIDYRREMASYDFLLGALGTAYEEKDESFALFGQAEWRLAPQWTVSASLRYTEESKDYAGGSFDIDPYGLSRITVAFPNVGGEGLFGTPTFDDEDVSGKVSLTWQPRDRAMVYLSAGKGFKSGGFDGSGITEEHSFTPFDSEKVWAYELGTKLTSPGGLVSFNGAAFFYDYEDQQVLALQDLGGGIIEAVIQNAAASEVYGLDMELALRPTDRLTLRLNGTWTETEVKEWVSADPQETLDHLGNELPGSPKLSYTASADWKLPLANGFQLGALAWVTYADGAFRDIENTPELKSEDRTLVNLRLELANPDRGISVYAYGHNIFDEDYVTSVRSLLGMLGEFRGEPSTYGLGFRYTFGAR